MAGAWPTHVCSYLLPWPDLGLPCATQLPTDAPHSKARRCSKVPLAVSHGLEAPAQTRAAWLRSLALAPGNPGALPPLTPISCVKGTQGLERSFHLPESLRNGFSLWQERKSLWGRLLNQRYSGLRFTLHTWHYHCHFKLINKEPNSNRTGYRRWILKSFLGKSKARRKRWLIKDLTGVCSGTLAQKIQGSHQCPKRESRWPKDVSKINIKSIKRISQSSSVNNYMCPKMSKSFTPKSTRVNGKIFSSKKIEEAF